MRLFLFMLLIAGFVGGCDRSSSEEALPNIIYILADDLGYGDLGVYNPESKIPTPNLDRLASEGMYFTDAHSPSSVCTPTRYGILTGRYPWRSRLPKGVLWGYGRALIQPSRVTVAEMLQANGYRTAVVGKWHLGLDWAVKEGHEQAAIMPESPDAIASFLFDMDPADIDFTQSPTNGPLDHGFGYSYILPSSLDIPPYCYLENNQFVVPPTDSTAGNDLNTGFTEAFWRKGRMAPGFDFYQVLPTFEEKATQYIQERVRTEERFFLYLPLPAPHTPWVPTEAFADKTTAGTYGDFVAMVDAMVGSILQTLKDGGIEDNTLLIFTSDNGPYWRSNLVERYQHRAAGPLRGMKGDAWEGGHRVPFIAKWTGKIEAGSQSAEVISLTDLMATCADLLNYKLSEDEGEDSYSLLPVLRGQSYDQPLREATVHHSSGALFAIRKGNWKLITGKGSGGFSPVDSLDATQQAPGQLYNLEKDIGEQQNLYLEKGDIVEELEILLNRYKNERRSR